MNSNLNKILSPFNIDSLLGIQEDSKVLIYENLTTERNLILDILQMFCLPGLESQTFERDRCQLKVLFKIRNEDKGYFQKSSLTHLSKEIVNNILLNFLKMANDLQKTMFYFRGI